MFEATTCPYISRLRSCSPSPSRPSRGSPAFCDRCVVVGPRLVTAPLRSQRIGGSVTKDEARSLLTNLCALSGHARARQIVSLRALRVRKRKALRALQLLYRCLKTHALRKGCSASTSVGDLHKYQRSASIRQSRSHTPPVLALDTAPCRNAPARVEQGLVTEATSNRLPRDSV